PTPRCAPLPLHALFRLGQAIASAFGAEGASVVVADIDAEAASATATAIGANALAVATDVTSPEAQDRLFGRVRAQFDRLDILVKDRKSTRLNSSHEWTS